MAGGLSKRLLVDEHRITRRADAQLIGRTRLDLGSRGKYVRPRVHRPGGLLFVQGIIRKPNKCLLIFTFGRMQDGGMPNKRGPKPRPAEERRDTNLIVGCRADWKEWVHRFARSERTTPASLADQGLAALALLRGFDVPPVR
jgi:hypothetical protein